MIIFINDLHKSVRHSQKLYSADDTNLLYANKSMKKVNKHINHDLCLRHCLCLCLSLSLFLSLFLFLSLIVQCLLEKLSTLQDKAIRTINFKQYDHSVDELYHTNLILKIKEYIDLLNCLFVKTVIPNESLPVFSQYFE